MYVIIRIINYNKHKFIIDFINFNIDNFKNIDTKTVRNDHNKIVKS
jgi:hypothetical protein